MKKWHVKEVGELEAVAKEVLTVLKERQDGSTAAVLALHGDLGAGKTTFMQTLARELGVSDTVVSPTFVIMKLYETTDETFPNLAHIDAYRIEDADEMRPLRFTELLEQPDAIIAIEWAEHISELLPEHSLHLSIAIEGEERTITLRHDQES